MYRIMKIFPAIGYQEIIRDIPNREEAEYVMVELMLTDDSLFFIESNEGGEHVDISKT